MRPLPVIVAFIGLATVLLCAVGARAGAPPQAPGRHAVIAELFTSEGCSSCPPADALLQRIAAQSPVPGVEILALEEHVDYWDNLGWRDPFSSPLFTRRQNDYEARVTHFGEVYTPQLVVDGAFASVGSDAGAARESIAKAAARPAANIRVTAQAADGRVHVEVAVDVPEAVGRRKNADIVAAVVEDGLTTSVERGENRGRTLPHFAVVRSLNPIGSLESSASTATAASDLPLAREWQPSRLRIVAFVQEKDTRRILGSAGTAIAAAARQDGAQAGRDHIEVKTSVARKTIAAGDTLALRLDVKPMTGVHVYAPGAAGYRPIALHIDPLPGVVAGQAHFPASEDLFVESLGEHVPIYQKAFQITQVVRVDRVPNLVRAFGAENEVTFSGRLEYQACTDTVCFPPQTAPVSWTVAVK
jgi:hypothetical protein